MKSRSTSKLTNTMLTQLQQNQYLRIKLIQLQKISKQKDNFYLSIFKQQEMITQKIMKQLILAQEKIKQLIKSRICNNWKEQYDTLAQSVGFYVKDVNQLIQSYMKSKQNLQQKTYKNSDLYEYYSSTLEECGKKFDQAQSIIQQLNNQINQYKQTISELDQALQQKIKIIEQQERLILLLNQQIHNCEQFSQKQQYYQNQLMRLSQENKNIIQCNKQMDEIGNQLKGEIEKQRQQVQLLLQSLDQKQRIMQGMNNQIISLQYRISTLQTQIEQRAFHVQKPSQKFKISNLKRNQVQYGSIYHQSRRKALNFSNSMNDMSLLDLSQNQLHLKKILEQQQRIKVLQKQDQYYKKAIAHLQGQNQKLIQSQRQYLHRQTYQKQQIQNIKNKLTTNNIELQQIKRKLEQQKEKALFYQKKSAQLENQYSIQKEGLNDQISRLQKQKYALKSQFQKLFKQFQEFLKESQQLKSNEQQFKRQSLKISNLQISQKIQIRSKKLIAFNNSSNKKKNLSIAIPGNQNFFQSECFQLKQKNYDDNINMPMSTKNKKFNLQNFQQKTSPHLSGCFSPKVGDIFNLTHGQGHKNVRW